MYGTPRSEGGHTPRVHDKWVKSFSVLTPDPKTRGNSLKMDSNQDPDGNCIVEMSEGDEYIVSFTYL